MRTFSVYARAGLCALALLSYAGVAQSANRSALKRAIRMPFNNEVLFVSQSVTVGMASHMAVKIGFLTSTAGSGTSLDKGSIVVRSGDILTSPSPIPQVEGATADMVEAQAKAHIGSLISSFVPRMSAYMKQKKLATGWFSFEQVMPVLQNGVPTTMSVAWSAYLANYGDPSTLTYGNPVLVPTSPTILQAFYSSSRVDEAIPSDWKYPDAGVLKYRVLNTRWEPISEWTSVATGGIFDEAEATTGESTESSTEMDHGVRCMVDRSKEAGCPSGYTDLRTIMIATGSIIGALDYTRSLTPVRDEEGNLMIALDITNRTLTTSPCLPPLQPPAYSNVGAYGLDMVAVTDKFAFTRDGDIAKTSETSASPDSPTKVYSKTVATTASTPSALSGYVINPLEGQYDLVSTSDIRIKSLAAVVAVDDATPCPVVPPVTPPVAKP